VSDLTSGTFKGGPGDDTVGAVRGGVFDGGEGHDSVLGCADSQAVLIDVEEVNPNSCTP
jgi:hypothetical protein